MLTHTMSILQAAVLPKTSPADSPNHYGMSLISAEIDVITAIGTSGAVHVYETNCR